MPESRESPSPASSASPDGRSARRLRTRQAVIEAFEDLLVAEDRAPTADRVAERAGVSTRSVYGHFVSLDELFAVVAQRATARVIELLWPIDPTVTLLQRIEEITRQRARVNEEMGPLRRAAARQAGRSAVIDQVRRDRDTASRAQVERVFSAELVALPPAARRQRAAMLDALLSGEAWDRLRGPGGLDPDEATRAVADTVEALLGPDTPLEPPAT